MKPHYRDDWLTVYAGDALTVLRDLDAAIVHCVVTSPPYWGLRDYGSDGQLGLEPTPEQYVANLVAVFREVKRVLRDDGTLWLNLGDSYANTGSGDISKVGGFTGAGIRKTLASGKKEGTWQDSRPRDIPSGLKPKDLVGIPWRVAFALQADGWYLRSDIIWAKPNPMPESVTDRPTKSHEYLFLLSKSARYYYDADAVAEPSLASSIARYAYGDPETSRINKGGSYREKWNNGDKHIGVPTVPDNPATRNLRSVWTIATRPYPGAHFAVFPPQLPERCIKAGSSERGVCPECGAPWERVVERESVVHAPRGTQPSQFRDPSGPQQGSIESRVTTLGWRPTCVHYCDGCIVSGYGELHAPHGATVPATILDPFAGSGTVGLVANRLSRRAILIDLNPAYLDQQMARNAQTPLGLAL